jgi:hypothetical protein
MARAAELTEQLRGFGDRPAGSEAERAAAVWTARQIRSDPRRSAEVQTFWSRPNWVGAQAWHVLLAIIGSLLATTEARPGAAVICVALVCMLADWFTCRSPGRLLTRERASQNVVSISPREPPVRLIITAGLDTARIAPDTRRRWLGGWLFWVIALTLWCLAVALARIDGSRDVIVAVLQLVPTVGLIMVFSWLLVGAQPADDAQGAAAALALVRILDAAPPGNLAVDLVLTGAGAGYGQGLRRYLRARRKQLNVTNTVVLGLGGGADLHYLVSDGPLLPLVFFSPLRRLAAESARFSAQTGRGCSPALPARMRRLPALTVGGEPDAVVNACLELVDAVDAYVGGLDRSDRVVLHRPVPKLSLRQRKA